MYEKNKGILLCKDINTNFAKTLNDKSMKSRRDFLKTAAVAVAGGLVAPSLLSSCGSSSSATTKTIGLQLYSLREMEKEKGIVEVLKAVAKMGYKRLETANYDNGLFYSMKPSEFKKVVDDLGMSVTSSHLSKAYDPEKKNEIMAWWDQATEAHSQLGVKYMIQPWMPVNADTTLDYIKMYCDYFSSVGMLTARSSIAFGYHNHDFEFKKIDDTIIYDFMLENVSKNHVLFELDVYWIQKGGYNPVDYMKKYASQIKVLHIKDDKELGASGTMDFEAIFNQAYANNIKDWYVEVEQYTNNNPEESVKQSFDFLNNAPYVK